MIRRRNIELRQVVVDECGTSPEPEARWSHQGATAVAADSFQTLPDSLPLDFEQSCAESCHVLRESGVMLQPLALFAA